MHNETRSALVFVGFFFGFLALIAVAGLGGWWFMKHIAHEPFAHRHAAMTRATNALSCGWVPANQPATVVRCRLVAG